MENKTQIKVIVEGMVQGVFFRASTRETAVRLGITGWVKNMPDKTVHALFQGEPDVLSKMIDWCKKGPSGSRVDHIRSEEQALSTEYQTFEIQY